MLKGFDIPTWLVAVGTILAGAGAFIPLIFKRKNKTKEDTEIYKALQKDALLGSILMNIKYEISEIELVSIIAFTNHAKPINFQVLYSTDTDTQNIWNVRQPMEGNLLTLVYEMIRNGSVHYSANDLTDKTVQAWYEVNGLKKTYMYTIGIGEFYLETGKNKEQALIALVVNSNKREIMAPDVYLKLQTYVTKTREVIKGMSIDKKLIR